MCFTTSYEVCKLAWWVCSDAQWQPKSLFSALKSKGKGFPYSIPNVGPGADPGVQAVSLQVTVSHPPGGRLPLLHSTTALWPVPSYTAW